MTNGSDCSEEKISQLRYADLLRVNVVGTSASGKSTFSRHLAARLGSEYIEMDQLFWEPNWQEPSTNVFRERLTQILQLRAWVLDGNYHGKTKDIKWEKASLVVWLDMSFGRTIWQSVSRSIGRAWSKKEIWPNTGNSESFRRSFFSADSVVLWAIKSYGRTRNRYLACMAEREASGLHFVRLRNKTEIASFMRTVDALLESRSTLEDDVCR